MKRCPACGSKRLSSKERNIEIDGGIAEVTARVIRCRDCGEETVVIDKLETLYRELAEVIARDDTRLLSAEEARWLRKYLGFSTSDWANYVGVRRETVSQWENGHRDMPLATQRLLRQLVLSGRQFHDYEDQTPRAATARIQMAQNSVGEWVRV